MAHLARGLASLILCALPLAASAFTVAPGRAFASGQGAAPCTAGRVCDARLGISLRLPPGWYVLGKKQVAANNQISFAAPGSHGPSYNLRLIIDAFAVTSFANSRRSAQKVVDNLISAERVREVSQSAVHYAGTFGLIVAGLPIGPTPAREIFLARHQYVYQIIAPGQSLGTDQRTALNSLRFVPRRGPFLGAHG